MLPSRHKNISSEEDNHSSYEKTTEEEDAWNEDMSHQLSSQSQQP